MAKYLRRNHLLVISLRHIHKPSFRFSCGMCLASKKNKSGNFLAAASRYFCKERRHIAFTSGEGNS
jgi:hypothetical protein